MVQDVHLYQFYNKLVSVNHFQLCEYYVAISCLSVKMWSLLFSMQQNTNLRYRVNGKNTFAVTYRRVIILTFLDLHFAMFSFCSC